MLAVPSIKHEWKPLWSHAQALANISKTETLKLNTTTFSLTKISWRRDRLVLSVSLRCSSITRNQCQKLTISSRKKLRVKGGNYESPWKVVVGGFNGNSFFSSFVRGDFDRA